MRVIKPVNKGAKLGPFREYGLAKADLIERLGEFCSYCERKGDPQDLHVEHIYPKDPHPMLERNWSNFLLSCSTCNSYKNSALGNGRQTKLLSKSLWPHIDNTGNAFDYDQHGRVTISAGISAANGVLAAETLRLTGLGRTPAVAATFHAKGIAYDSTRKREEAWAIAADALNLYQSNRTAAQLAALVRTARLTGYFSIWMTVFHAEVLVRRELIVAFRACAACYDPTTTALVARMRL